VLLQVAWVGRGRDRLLSELAARYLDRLRRLGSVELDAVPPGESGEAHVDRGLEAQRLRAVLRRRSGRGAGGRRPASHALVALHERGRLVTSRGLFELLDGFARQGRQRVTFVLGGDDGLDPSLVTEADAVIALSRMTLTHDLARVLLLEQLYRAEAIRTGHPYHRDG
jgi:23S rRNA (pseudouridine1915-N3)-methyltransferase